jgi:secreted PhoX family phosphatase
MFGTEMGISKSSVMKRILVAVSVLALLLCFSTSSFAQQDAAARQAQMKEKLMTDLKMTSVQADSVVAVSSSYRPQLREIYQDQSLSQDQKMTKMKAISEQVDKRLQPVLGDSLLTQYKDWRQANMQRMQQQGGKPGGN